LENYPSSKKKYAIDQIAAFHHIIEVAKNKNNDTIQVIAYNKNTNFHLGDSIVIYSISYNYARCLDEVKLETKNKQPAYFGIFDSEISYSAIYYEYDFYDKEIGYEMYADTLLIQKQFIVEKPDSGSLTVYTLKRSLTNYSSLLDTFRIAIIKRNEYNYLSSFEEKLFSHHKEGRKIISYRYYKFDDLNGNLIEEPYTVFGNTKIGIENYIRMLYQYDFRGNVISWRKCDFNYDLLKPQPPKSKEEYEKVRDWVKKKNEEYEKKLNETRSRNDPLGYYVYYDTYEDYLNKWYESYLENWNDEIVMAVFIYSKNGKKKIAKRYLNYKGEIIYQENY